MIIKYKYTSNTNLKQKKIFSKSKIFLNINIKSKNINWVDENILFNNNNSEILMITTTIIINWLFSRMK